MKEILLDKVCPVCGKVHEDKYSYRGYVEDTQQFITHNRYYMCCEECSKFKEAYSICPNCGQPEGKKNGLYGNDFARMYGCSVCTDTTLELEQGLRDLLRRYRFQATTMSEQTRELFNELIASVEEDISGLNSKHSALCSEYSAAPSYKDTIKTTKLF